MRALSTTPHAVHPAALATMLVLACSGTGLARNQIGDHGQETASSPPGVTPNSSSLYSPM